MRLGDGVAIGAYCVLKDVTIDAGTQIAAVLPSRGRDDRRELPGRPVSRGCARARSLLDDVHVGNFVEVKASRIGRGSKANHLAYIGDTTMGAASTSARARSPPTTTARTSIAP